MKQFIKIYWAVLLFGIMISCLAISCHDISPSESKDSTIRKYRTTRDTNYDWWVRLRNSDKHKRAIKENITPENK